MPPRMLLITCVAAAAMALALNSRSWAAPVSRMDSMTLLVCLGLGGRPSRISASNCSMASRSLSRLSRSQNQTRSRITVSERTEHNNSGYMMGLSV